MSLFRLSITGARESVAPTEGWNGRYTVADSRNVVESVAIACSGVGMAERDLTSIVFMPWVLVWEVTEAGVAPRLRFIRWRRESIALFRAKRGSWRGFSSVR